MLNDPTRLNKYISQSGMCSRREADEFIEAGKVKINGKLAETGDLVYPGDKVEVAGNLIDPSENEELIFIALNKPVGIVSTTEGSEKDNIVDYVGHSSRIFPIGRLDKDSQGLIFMTNNGDIVNKILRAGNNHEKEYIVTVDKLINENFIKGMSGGVPILGVMTKKCKVEQLSANVFRIVLVQGLNRQIRRMTEYFGYNVTKLERTRIMNIDSKGLAPGDWRDCTKEELDELFELIKNSSSEDEKVIRATQANMPKKGNQKAPPKKPIRQRKKKKSKYEGVFAKLEKDVTWGPNGKPKKSAKQTKSNKPNRKKNHR